MHHAGCPNAILPRAVLASVLGVACALIVAAPLLARYSFHFSASILYVFFSSICHQIPERSFVLFGNSLAVCHRCSGIYLGMFIGSLFNIHAIHRSVRARRLWAAGGIIPIVFDALAPFAGLWTSTALTRFSTGLLFGIVASSLLARGFSELLREAPWQRLTMQNSQLKGGLS